MSTTSSMEACGRLESEELRVQVGSIGVGSPARKEFWVVRGLEVMGIKIRIDVWDWSLKYCYELGMELRVYRGSICSARTWLQLMCCATRRLLSSNFGRGTDEGSEVWVMSSRDNQCRFQTEEHT